MDEESTQNRRSESAFFGTSDDAARTAAHIVTEIAESDILLLAELLKNPLRTSKYMSSLALLVPKRIIPAHDRNDILKVTVAKTSDPRHEVSLYTTHLPGYKHAYVDLRKLKVGPSEEFWVRSVEVAHEWNVAERYSLVRPKGLENTKLVWSQGQVSMFVDGKEIPLANRRFRAFQGQMVLECELGIAGRVKISCGVVEPEIRLRDHSLVRAIWVRDGGVWLNYFRTADEKRPHLRLVVRPSNDFPRGDQDLSWISEGQIKVVGESGVQPSSYLVEVDERTLHKVADALNGVKSVDEYREAKGEIAECIVSKSLPQLGLDLVADHPKSPGWWPSKAKRPGPDSLVKPRAGGSLGYVECKWWGQVSKAEKEAAEQVLLDLRRWPTYRGEKVTEGYIAVIQWETQSPVFRLRFARVV